MSTAQPEEQLDGRMTFIAHLIELRMRLFRAVLGLIPAMFLTWGYKEQLLDWIVQPLVIAYKKLDLGAPQLHFLNPVDPFVAYFKLSIVAGLLLVSPWIFWQMWAFIAPGLYSRERRLALPFVAASTLCFVGGTLFGYYVVFPMGFETLLDFAGALPSGDLKVTPTITISEYLDFSLQMLLAFGIVFEVPVVVTFLAVAGLVNWKQLLEFGRWWIVIAAVIAGVLTPPDVGSQIMMLVPLVVLYFASVLLAYFLGPKPDADPLADDGDGTKYER
jgi:sec-independent protein translocase protein TatC